MMTLGFKGLTGSHTLLYQLLCIAQDQSLWWLTDNYTVCVWTRQQYPVGPAARALPRSKIPGGTFATRVSRSAVCYLQGFKSFVASTAGVLTNSLLATVMTPPRILQKTATVVGNIKQQQQHASAILRGSL